MPETQVRSLGQEDPLEKEMATHSSILAWEIPWTEDPGRLQSMEWDTSERLHFHLHPLQYSWASLVAQLVKNPPAMLETWVGKIPWRTGRLPSPVFWPGEFHGLYSPMGLQRDRTESSFFFQPVHIGPASESAVGWVPAT